jgi:hypothetical protein
MSSSKNVYTNGHGISFANVKNNLLLMRLNWSETCKRKMKTQNFVITVFSQPHDVPKILKYNFREKTFYSPAHHKMQDNFVQYFTCTCTHTHTHTNFHHMEQKVKCHLHSSHLLTAIIFSMLSAAVDLTFWHQNLAFKF